MQKEGSIMGSDKNSIKIKNIQLGQAAGSGMAYVQQKNVIRELMDGTQHSFSNQSQMVTTPFEGYEGNNLDGKPKMSSTYFKMGGRTMKSPMHKTSKNKDKTQYMLRSEH